MKSNRRTASANHPAATSLDECSSHRTVGGTALGKYGTSSPNLEQDESAQATASLKPSSRRVVTRTPSRTVRLINLKGLLPGPVESESSLEADYVRRAALCPETEVVIPQAFSLPVSPKGYTPDFLQIFRSLRRKAVVEIKPKKMVAKYAALFDRAAEFLAPKGYTFYVVTDAELRRDKIHDRVLMILRYAKARFPESELQGVIEQLQDRENGLPLGSLVRKAKVRREAILHLIAWKTLTTGPRLKIDDSAVVRLRKLCRPDDETTFERWFGVAPWGNTAGTRTPDSRHGNWPSASGACQAASLDRAGE